MKKNNLLNLLKSLYKINRGINSSNNIYTLEKFKNLIPNLKIKYFNKNRVFDWKIPLRWNVKEAFIANEKKQKIVDIKDNYLHILQNSTNINKIITLSELKKNLFFLKKYPNAIPYVTSYYKKRWGFCLSYNKFKKLRDKKYLVRINSKFSKKPLPYGEIFFKGKSRKEIIFSTYICHPNLAQDNLSGQIVQLFLVQYLNKIYKKFKTRYSYRFLFISETIGSLSYLNSNLKSINKNFIAGYVLSCLGRGKVFNIIKKYKENLSFDFINNFLSLKKNKFNLLNWKKRGSDERQYNAPNINLPFICLTKKRFGDYKEYHTSMDNLKFIKIKDLNHSINFLKNFINFIEKNLIFISKVSGEPFLTRRKLISNVSASYKKQKNQDTILDVIDLCDGKNSLIEIKRKLNIKNNKLNTIVNLLLDNNLIRNI